MAARWRRPALASTAILIALDVALTPFAGAAWTWSQSPPLTGSTYTQLASGSGTGSGSFTVIASPAANLATGDVSFDVSTSVTQPTGGSVTADGTAAGFAWFFSFTGTTGTYHVFSDWRVNVKVQATGTWTGVAGIHSVFGFNSSIYDGKTLVASGSVRLADFWALGTWISVGNFTSVSYNAGLVFGHSYELTVSAFTNLYAGLPATSGSTGSIGTNVFLSFGAPFHTCSLISASVT